MTETHDHSEPAASSAHREDADPRQRPHDPAGTRPKVDPESLRPSSRPQQLALTAGAPASVLEPADGLSREVAPAPAVQNTLARGASELRSIHAPRFQFLVGALVALGAAAIALTFAILGGPGSPRAIQWSSWSPVSGAGDPAEQIALHVGPQYKLPNGHELLQVTGGPQAIGGQPVVLAVRNSGSEPSALPNNGVFYQLCGAGPHCSIPGKASEERALLVKREALELALYTFRYINQSSQVLVTFPPPPPSAAEKKAGSAPASSKLSTSAVSSQTPSHVLLFRPGDLATQLNRPLEATLPAKVPSVKAMKHSPEAPLVNRLTLNAVYDSTLSQQESTLVMLLQAPGLGG